MSTSFGSHLGKQHKTGYRWALLLAAILDIYQCTRLLFSIIQVNWKRSIEYKSKARRQVLKLLHWWACWLGNSKGVLLYKGYCTNPVAVLVGGLAYLYCHWLNSIVDAASKHALQAFFDSLRAEVTDQGIHVSVISPSYIRTKLSENSITADGTTYGCKYIKYRLHLCFISCFPGEPGLSISLRKITKGNGQPRKRKFGGECRLHARCSWSGAGFHQNVMPHPRREVANLRPRRIVIHVVHKHFSSLTVN